MVQEFLRDTWWRFDRYEVDQGFIRPAAGAHLQRFDPWKQHADLAQRRRDHEPPYVTLARLSRRMMDVIYGSDYLEPLPLELAADIGAWCSEWGLLGVLLSGLRAVTPTIHWRSHDFDDEGHFNQPPVRTLLRGTHVVPVLTSYEWSSGGWRRTDLALAKSHEELAVWSSGGEGDPFSVKRLSRGYRRIVNSWLPAPGYALRREDTPYFASRSWRLDPLHDEGWADFFPDAPGDPHTFDYPEPLSQQFWGLYAEPLVAFAEAGNAVMQALEEIRRPETVEPDQFREPDAPVETLRRLIEPVTPDVELDPTMPSQVNARWSSPCLQATLALMAYVDLTGGDRIDACPVCGSIFVAHRADHEYCSTRCKATARKRRQRSKRPTDGAKGASQ